MPHQTVGHKYLYPSHLLVACWVAKNICICTFSINADMQFRQNSERFNWTSYLYYTHFLINIYWHFIQKPDKIPKTHKFWGLKYIFDIPFSYLKRKFQKIILQNSKPHKIRLYRLFVCYKCVTKNHFFLLLNTYRHFLFLCSSIISTCLLWKT